MSGGSESDQMYERLVAINHEAFAGGYYETAYHALAAAMHRAVDIGAAHLLAQVEDIATEQMNQINTSEPQHPLSSQSAQAQGRYSIYALLARQAVMRRQMIKA